MPITCGYHRKRFIENIPLGGESITQTKRHAAAFLGKGVIQLYPWSLRAHVEVKGSRLLGIRIKSPKPESEQAGRIVWLLEERRTATAREIPMDAWARLPARNPVLPRDQHEVFGSHTDCRSKA
jgi:hypothetical protein